MEHDNYKVDVIIQSPNNPSERREVKMIASFFKSDSGYGNDTYLSIKGRDGTQVQIDDLIDLRYDARFDQRFREIILANLIYKRWSGENMSYDVKSLTITKYERLPKVNKRPVLSGDVIS